MKAVAASLCCLIPLAGCDNQLNPNTNAKAAIIEGISLSPCRSMLRAKPPTTEYQISYKLGTKDGFHTVLKRKATHSDAGLQITQDTFFVGGQPIAQRQTSEWFGLLVVEVVAGTEKYVLMSNDLKPEVFTRLLAGREATIKGQFRSNLGGTPARGNVTANISLLGCKPSDSGADIHVFRVRENEGSKKTQSEVDLDVARGVVIESRVIGGTGAIMRLTE